MYTFLQIRLLLQISFWSTIGVLARTGLNKLTYYHNNYINSNGESVLWSNFAACFIMGALSFSSYVWEPLLTKELPSFSSKKSIPLYIGLTTGFCGTFSSFSSLTLEAFMKAANFDSRYKGSLPNGAYGIMECLSVEITQISVSIFGYHAGRHFIEVIDPHLPQLKYKMVNAVQILTELVAFAVIVAMLVLACVLPNHHFWKPWALSICFAPFGAILRYILSAQLNHYSSRFFIGTFAANILGSVLLGIFSLLGLVESRSLSKIVLSSLAQGFCGALTTVSTFVGELVQLKRNDGYVYGFISLSSSFIVILLLVGPYRWVNG